MPPALPRNSSSPSAFFASDETPSAAVLIESSVPPTFSKALVAAARAPDGSGAIDPSMIGACLGESLVAIIPWPVPGRMSIETSPIRARETRGVEPALSLYFRSRERVTRTPSGSDRFVTPLAESTLLMRTSIFVAAAGIPCGNWSAGTIPIFLSPRSTETPASSLAAITRPETRGRSSKRIEATSPMRIPLFRTGIPSPTPGASAKWTVT